MKYLLNWIEKELNPERHVSSKTTSSEYYYFYGAKVRFADHISDRNDSDLEIILVKDLTGQNKHYLIKEQNYPAMASVPDVKTLKIVLSTFIFQFKNRYSDNIVKEANKSEENKKILNTCLNQLRSNNNANLDIFQTFDKCIYSIIPQWHNMKQIYRIIFMHLFKLCGDIDSIKNIIDVEFPNDNQNDWHHKNTNDIINILVTYFPDDYNIRNIIGLDETISPKEKFANCFNEYYKNLDVNIEDMKEEDKSKFLNAFGSLLALDTKNKYAKCSDHQKKYIRSLLNEHISYDNILKFVNSIFDVMFTPKMKHKNDAPQMKVIVDKFLRMYNIGIIKFPNEYDFDSTYNNKFNHIDVTQEESTDIEKTTDDTTINENIEVTDAKEPCNDIQYETIVDYIPDTDITIKDSYNYASTEFDDIHDIHEMFEQNQINILNDVIKKINDTNKYTSFETRRITDIFAAHYADIWEKLTWTQKELCSSIITNERMNLSETDYIINKIFDKTTFNFPVTELCRKYIKEYSQRIKESRMAA